MKIAFTTRWGFLRWWRRRPRRGCGRRCIWTRRKKKNLDSSLARKSTASAMSLGLSMLPWEWRVPWPPPRRWERWCRGRRHRRCGPGARHWWAWAWRRRRGRCSWHGCRARRAHRRRSWWGRRWRSWRRCRRGATGHRGCPRRRGGIAEGTQTLIKNEHLFSLKEIFISL